MIELQKSVLILILLLIVILWPRVGRITIKIMIKSRRGERTGERTMPDLHGGRSGIGKTVLSAEAKLFEDRGVAIELGALEVVEKLTTTCCHRDETTA